MQNSKWKKAKILKTSDGRLKYHVDVVVNDIRKLIAILKETFNPPRSVFSTAMTNLYSVASIALGSKTTIIDDYIDRARKDKDRWDASLRSASDLLSLIKSGLEEIRKITGKQTVPMRGGKYLDKQVSKIEIQIKSIIQDIDKATIIKLLKSDASVLQVYYNDKPSSNVVFGYNPIKDVFYVNNKEMPNAIQTVSSLIVVFKECIEELKGIKQGGGVSTLHKYAQSGGDDCDPEMCVCLMCCFDGSTCCDSSYAASAMATTSAYNASLVPLVTAGPVTQGMTRNAQTVPQYAQIPMKAETVTCENLLKICDDLVLRQLSPENMIIYQAEYAQVGERSAHASFKNIQLQICTLIKDQDSNTIQKITNSITDVWNIKSETRGTVANIYFKEDLYNLLQMQILNMMILEDEKNECATSLANIFKIFVNKVSLTALNLYLATLPNMEFIRSIQENICVLIITSDQVESFTKFCQDSFNEQFDDIRKVFLSIINELKRIKDKLE
jgi:hypothetical protein